MLEHDEVKRLYDSIDSIEQIPKSQIKSWNISAAGWRGSAAWRGEVRRGAAQGDCRALTEASFSLYSLILSLVGITVPFLNLTQKIFYSNTESFSI